MFESPSKGGLSRVLGRYRSASAPALRWEEVVERLFALAAAGRTDERGVPEREAAIALLREYPQELAPPSRRAF